MLDYVDLQYADKVSVRFEKYEVKSRSPFEANFRCPYCGDSAKSKHKARGWFFEGKAGIRFFCHNCGVSVNFYRFLKENDPVLYNEYVAEKYLNSGHRKKTPTPKVLPTSFKTDLPIFKKDVLSQITRVSSLGDSHPARVYLEQVRQLPNIDDIFYARDFNGWINGIIPNKLHPRKEPRIVIPFRDEQGNVFGVTGRSFEPSGLRYITIMFDEDKPKIFGLDKVDFSKKYYMVEGQFDSMFLKNSIAMAGADGNTSFLKNIDKCVTVYDNEARNKEIVARMNKLIDQGRQICIWPNGIKYKDLNDMVTLENIDVKSVIDENTYSGLSAKLRLSEWRKI